jgi:hypothetical protein
MGDRQFWPLVLALVRHRLRRAVKRDTDSQPTVTLTGTSKRMCVTVLAEENANPSHPVVLPW